jgi:hypothetical protein
MSTKLKEYSYTTIIQGVEVYIICCTTSKKKFAEIIDKSVNFVNTWCYIIEPRTKECIDNIDVLFAKRGIGGECMYFLDDKIYTLQEMKELIENHRNICKTYSETIEWSKGK